jgi:hypothetical protein
MAADKEADEEIRKLEEAGKWFRQDFLRFAREERFALTFASAISIYWNGHYTIENAEQMSQNEAFRFVDWFVFDYKDEDGSRLIDLYYEDRYEELSKYQQQVLTDWLTAQPASAYELIDYKDQNLELRDFFSGSEVEVYEPAGHGPVQPGDLLLARIVPVRNRLEFSSVVAYLPQDEIGDLKEKMAQAVAADAEKNPGTSEEDSIRRQSHLIIHHALDQAEIKGRPPVAGSDPNRTDELVRKAATRMRKLQQRLR